MSTAFIQIPKRRLSTSQVVGKVFEAEYGVSFFFRVEGLHGFCNHGLHCSGILMPFLGIGVHSCGALSGQVTGVVWELRRDCVRAKAGVRQSCSQCAPLRLVNMKRLPHDSFLVKMKLADLERTFMVIDSLAMFGATLNRLEFGVSFLYLCLFPYCFSSCP